MALSCHYLSSFNYFLTVLLQFQRVMGLSCQQGVVPAQTASEGDCLHERRLTTNMWGKQYCVLYVQVNVHHDNLRINN
jgi:hypothetical protein